MSNTAALMGLFRLNLRFRKQPIHHHPEVAYFLQQQEPAASSEPTPQTRRADPKRNGGESAAKDKTSGGKPALDVKPIAKRDVEEVV